MRIRLDMQRCVVVVPRKKPFRTSHAQIARNGSAPRGFTDLSVSYSSFPSACRMMPLSLIICSARFACARREGIC